MRKATVIVCPSLCAAVEPFSAKFDGAAHATYLVKYRDSQRSSLERASENASVERIVSGQRRACCQHRGGQSCRASESQAFALHLFDRNAALLLRRWWAKEGCMSKWARKGTACGGSLRNVSLACSVCVGPCSRLHPVRRYPVVHD